MGSEITTVSVDKDSTYKRLSRRRNAMDTSHRPGERTSMDDVISDLLDKAERFEEMEVDPDGEGEVIETGNDAESEREAVPDGGSA